jgi:hypothetical protein
MNATPHDEVTRTSSEEPGEPQTKAGQGVRQSTDRIITLMILKSDDRIGQCSHV